MLDVALENVARLMHAAADATNRLRRSSTRAAARASATASLTDQIRRGKADELLTELSKRLDARRRR